jgi:hypothetical protein
MIKRGPVDVVVMAAGDPRADGTVYAELERQVAAGTIRVLDLMVLYKDDEGKCWRVDPQGAAVGLMDGATRGLFDTMDENTLYEGMVPGSAIFALAIEHTWAIDLVNALYDAGVETALNFRVPAPVVDEAFASLEVQA